jgi:Co/Zn/Cd efflux system component
MERAYCKHQHVFHVPKKEEEGRVLLVFLLTLVFMFVEIASGLSLVPLPFWRTAYIWGHTP